MLDLLAREHGWVFVVAALLIFLITLAFATAFLWAVVKGRAVTLWPPSIGAETPKAAKQASAGPGVEANEGAVVSKADRSTTSTRFVQSAIRSVRIFSGDLSWLPIDLEVYRTLSLKGVKISILTDSPDVPAIAMAKVSGFDIRQYPEGMAISFRGTICDAETETESRVLVVRRRAPREATDGEYKYWMKMYHGANEYPIVNAVALYFDDLFARGRAV
jgi:hypothetical protein